MLDLRGLIRPLIERGPLTPERLVVFAAPAGGALLAALAWVSIGGSTAAETRIGGFEARLGQVRLTAPGPPSSDGLIAQASARPLFALTTGPGAIAEAAVKLVGLARSPQHSAALISINGAAAAWLRLGASRDGITLQSVGSSNVVLMTALGRREVDLGAGPSSPQSPPTQQTGSPQPAASPPPPSFGGFRMPPAPASAPGAGGGA